MVGIVHRARPARHLHRGRRRGDQRVQLGLLPLRRCSSSTRRSSWPARATSDDDEYEENRLIKWVERRFPATTEWHGAKLVAKENGKRLITPMFIVIVALGTTDLLFALDSIPAIYGLTKEPYLVLTANIFALMGLRQLYFLIGGLLERLVYLSIGLAVLLGFIGVKLILHAMHENELPFINGGEPIAGPRTSRSSCRWAPSCGILGVTTVASLVKTRRTTGPRSAADRSAQPRAERPRVSRAQRRGSGGPGCGRREPAPGCP